ncbi:MAG TPA: hypothetical protein VLV55_02475 [Rhizomicrobium sp.]|nr:hypothetical protein [Rhizomicrobium sp.]
MADENRGGGRSAMALIIGALMVIVPLGIWYVFAGGHLSGPPANTTHTVNLNVKGPGKGG